MKYNPEKRSSTILRYISDDPYSILSNEISSLLIDRNNTLFVGSFGRGISKYSPFNSKFDAFQIPGDEVVNPDMNSFTDAIEDSNGNLVTGTYHGFFVFDQQTWEHRHFLPGNSYESNKVLTLDMAPDGSIWICTMSGLHRYDEDYQKITTYYPDPALKDQSVYAIEFDYRNNLWIGLFNKGLIRVQEEEWLNNTGSRLNYRLYQLEYNLSLIHI